ncbi:MAG: tyrosine--tRNA ligase [Pseudomonadota bacterium]
MPDSFKSEFLNVMTERGFVHQMSDAEALDAALVEGVVTAYVGYDCTASSLHVGNLLSIMMLHWFQKTGHRPIALMGGGTTQVGDPSGKDETRQMLTLEKIEDNKSSIRQVFDRFLSFGDGSGDAVMEDNASWLMELNYIDLLRRVGSQMSVNEMIKRDSVAMRLERAQHLSFLEFNYMVLQAYDFAELNTRYGCRMQMGGSDQWGNIVAGVDLTRRLNGTQCFALTAPLLTTSSGAKMGKTAAGAVWLNADMLSVYDYWQYWRDVEDADVTRFLKLFTLLPLEEIARLGALEGAEINDAKKVLATEATALLHGRDAAVQAAETARRTFEEGAAADGLPRISIARSDLDDGLGLLSALVSAGLAKSNGEARRAVNGNAISVNDSKVGDPAQTLSRTDMTGDGVIKLSSGKKKHVLLVPE